MKAPILRVTGSLTVATVVAASLLIATTTRGDGKTGFRGPATVAAPSQIIPRDCPGGDCTSTACEPPCGDHEGRQKVGH